MTRAFTLTWYPPGGDVWNLTSDTLRTQVDTSGLGASPGDVDRTGLYAGGARVNHQRVTEQLLTLPIAVVTTPAGFNPLWREFTAAFTTTRRAGPGRLRLTRPDGAWREMVAYYLSGLEDGHGDGPALGHTLAALQLLAPDPFWYGPTVRALGFTSNVDRSFYAPFFTVSPGGGFGEVILNVESGVDTWPTWMFYGPFTTATIENADGRGFVVDRGTATGERVCVHTDPREFAVTVASATSEQGQLKSRNLVTNPSFEVDTGGWTANNGTITRDTTIFQVGAACLEFTPDGVNSAPGPYFGEAANADFSETHTYSAYMYVEGSVAWHPQLRWTDGAGGELKRINGPDNSVFGGWERLSLVSTPPSGAAGYFLTARPSAAPTTSDIVHLDAVMLTEGSGLQDYFDGDTAGAHPWMYQWDGTAHASTSSHYGTKSVYGDETPAPGALAWPDADPFPLEPGAQTVDLSMTGSASGSAIEVTYRPRYELP